MLRAFLGVSRRTKLPKTLCGMGEVLSAGLAPTKVRYELILEEALGEITCRGSLVGRHVALKPMWLTPSVTLRLEDARRVQISILTLDGQKATFAAAESNQRRQTPVP